jgi:hypothetical protein
MKQKANTKLPPINILKQPLQTEKAGKNTGGRDSALPPVSIT